MANLNRSTFIGKVYNIKPHTTNSGKPMVFFTIATWSKQGEGKEDKAQFHPCVAYAGLAEVIINHVTEKRELYIEAEVDYYEKDGVKHTQHKVQRFEFADGNPNRSAS
jgi:single-stranded DNA-binding protein